MRDVLLITLCLVSCGAPMPEDGQPGAAGAQGAAGRDGRDAVQAGSRLKPLWLVGADGSRMANGFWFVDTQRGERCVITAMAAEGPWYCVPVDMIGKLTPQNAAPYVQFRLE